jgi:PRTRC genetic system protein D
MWNLWRAQSFADIRPAICAHKRSVSSIDITRIPNPENGLFETPILAGAALRINNTSFLQGVVMKDPIIHVPVRASDLGYESSKHTLGRHGAGGQILTCSMQSHAPRLTEPTLPDRPGTPAAQGSVVRVGQEWYYVGSDVMSLCSLPPARPIDREFTRQPAYKALLLGGMSEQVRHIGATSELHIDHYIVGLPPSSFDACRDDVAALTRGDHLVPGREPGSLVLVRVNQATVVLQPQGSLVVVLGSRLNGARHSVLTADMGGGTTDVMVSQGWQIKRQQCGSTPLGTLACAEAVADRLRVDKSDPEVICLIDEALRANAATVVIEADEYPLESCWSVVDDVLADAMGQVRKLAKSLANVREFLLTGGGLHYLRRGVRTHMPKFERYVIFDRVDPVTANVRGFHQIGEILAKQKGDSAGSIA